ncbi:ASCH domain-containing protein [Intrasporangium sp.]|uniref:ASCH domain-containing protein n=1 Tax=Intrasporangium sp. TaxID=1925024 RepID=UPI00293A5569|nr:ASCH domain-containing protein [Intrasporangium sp.]MDV3222192.1 ASCH domain-containing protein [Intrasporangium sp.]
MLISKPIAEAIRDGRVTTQYRRWDAPRVKVGGTQLTSAGLVTFTRVAQVKDLDRVSDRAARAAGLKDAAALRRALAPKQRKPSARGSRGGDKVYRIHVAWVGEDPRISLRDRLPDAAELAVIQRRLQRLDARPTGAWTRDVLEWIRDHPRVVSKELAALRGVELLPLKADIRKLKALGLTISHEVGYELSPRGAAYLATLEGN